MATSAPFARCPKRCPARERPFKGGTPPFPRRAAALAPGSRLAIYEDAPHGLPITHADRLARNLLAFLDDAPR